MPSTRRRVDYYLSVASPWAYLGHARFWKLAEQHDLDVSFRPVDFSRVLDASGGLIYQKRSAQRRQYRQVELDRWRKYLGIPLNLEPAYYPVDRAPASLMLIACRHLSRQTQFQFVQSILAAIWRDDLDIANWEVLADLLKALGVDAEAIVAQARQPETQAMLGQHTDQAIQAGVFGVPAYVLEGELFWGQDRLDFLARALDH